MQSWYNRTQYIPQNLSEYIYVVAVWTPAGKVPSIIAITIPVFKSTTVDCTSCAVVTSINTANVTNDPSGLDSNVDAMGNVNVWPSASAR